MMLIRFLILPRQTIHDNKKKRKVILRTSNKKKEKKKGVLCRCITIGHIQFIMQKKTGEIYCSLICT